MSRLKILVFFLALCITGSVLAAAYWFYTRVMGHDTALETQIHEMSGKKVAPPDPGIRRFEAALKQVADGDVGGGRRALYELLDHFPDSTRAPEAKRIIGEVNMDMLFSPNVNPLKKDYKVQPGDSLGLIARKNQTTIECILRANNMLGGTLQPGDHLFVFPLDFEVWVVASKKTLQLLQNKVFYKEYQIQELRLPPGMRTPTTEPLTINEKSAWVAGKRVTSTDAQFLNSDKWLATNRAAFSIRAVPQAKPVIAPPPAPVVDPKAKKKKDASEDFSTRGEDLITGPEPGVFLMREDVEELFTILRTGTKLSVFR